MECCVTVPALSAIRTQTEKYWENFFLTGENLWSSQKIHIYESYSWLYFVSVGFLDRVTQTWIYKLFTVAEDVSWYRCWYLTWYGWNMMVTNSIPNLGYVFAGSVWFFVTAYCALTKAGGSSDAFSIHIFKTHRSHTHFNPVLDFEIPIGRRAECLCRAKTNHRSLINKHWCQTFLRNCSWWVVFMAIINLPGRNIADEERKLLDQSWKLFVD